MYNTMSFSNSEESLKINENSKIKIRELFNACDTKGIGIIGPNDFSKLCSNFDISKSDATAIFLDLDHDGDGQINFNDFKHGFTDFITPGSRRGSFQVNLSDGGNTVLQQLLEMEKKQSDAKKAWNHFLNRVGQRSVSSKQGIEHNPLNLEKTVTSLIHDVKSLHEDYKNLEKSFKREKQAHAVQLAALGEELDVQLAKAEAKAKDEARLEAQRQIESERQKIFEEMEDRLNDLSIQIKTFQKVEEWLSSEEKKRRSSGDAAKRVEAENENRQLRSALAEAQVKATILQSELAKKRSEYIDLEKEFRTEMVAASEYKNQCDYMQNHFSVLSKANQILADANDCLVHNEILTQDNGNRQLQMTKSLEFQSVDLNSLETDRDSGQETLYEELRAEGESSPLPSGQWSQTLPLTSTLHSTNAPIPKFITSNSLTQQVEHFDQLPKRPKNPEIFDSANASVIRPIPFRTFKVILAGDAGVGKTSFIERACNGHFVNNLNSTIGVDFRMKMIEMDGIVITLQLWDTAGQERYRCLTKSYFRRADGVILIYDVCSDQTFLNVRHWIQSIEEGSERKVPIVLCGSKIDLRRSGNANTVTFNDGFNLSRQYGILFAETSPKTGFNVVDILLLLTTEMSKAEDEELRSYVNLKELTNDEKVKKKACCNSFTTSDNPERKSN